MTGVLTFGDGMVRLILRCNYKPTTNYYQLLQVLQHFLLAEKALTRILAREAQSSNVGDFWGRFVPPLCIVD